MAAAAGVAGGLLAGIANIDAPEVKATVYRVPKVLQFKHIVFEDVYSQVDVSFPPAVEEEQ